MLRITSARAPHPARPRARPRSARRGFTVLEMMVVVVVLAVLASLIVPRFSGMAKREFRLVVEQVSDLMTMYAQREQLQRQPVGLKYDDDRRWLMLVVLDDGAAGGPDWVIDRYVRPVELPEGINLLEVLADGDYVDIADWPLGSEPNAQRPTISVTLEGREHTATVVLPGHAIVPLQEGLDERRFVSYAPIDLDGAGRSREQW